MKEFFMRGDSDEIAEAKRYVFEMVKDKKDFNVNDHLASRVASHYEFWGKMVKLGYLPIKTFSGAAGRTAVNLYEALKPMIENRRHRGNPSNPEYARDFLWLKTKIENKYHISNYN